MRRVEFVVFVLHDEDGRILVQDRRGYSKWGEDWAFFGGHVEAGETSEQALRRECSEELGCELDDLEFIGDHENAYKDVIYHGSIYVAQLKDRLPSFVFGEGAGAKLFTLDEIEHINIIDGHRKMIPMLRKCLGK